MWFVFNSLTRKIDIDCEDVGTHCKTFLYFIFFFSGKPSFATVSRLLFAAAVKPATGSGRSCWTFVQLDFTWKTCVYHSINYKIEAQAQSDSCVIFTAFFL